MHDDFLAEGFASISLSTQQARDATLLRATTELFAQQPAHEYDAVRRYEEVVLHLLPKVGAAERAFVAERLSDRSDAPAAVVRMLAKDTIAIAEPILRTSPVLGSLDLLIVIAATGAEHHRLVAGRPHLPPEVVRALHIGGDATVAAILAGRASIPTIETSAASMPPGSEGTPAAEVHTAPADAPAVRREAPAPTANRFDPWRYLDLDRPARLRLMAELATRPPIRRYGGQASRLDRAFRSILSAAQIVGHARNGQRTELVAAIADGLDLEADFITACLDDDTGEPLAVLLKALSLDSVQAQQIFLLSAPKVGRDANVFFRLCDLYAGMEPTVAEALIESWRETRVQPLPKHQPLFADTDGRDRPAAATDPARERAAPAPERLMGNTKA